ncbi:LysM domain-containing protein [uncultured Limosilactobacillus sp.]|uniref:LysM peptidoglycan-binding domain-containing protein n=1 Tax=uncultured Limosilactobacillus sp. TaxID=2837629 RepID=UPI0025FB97A1|nr:LysM domain-containing protein [uncultured Limosilactobacillus sp.]
MNSKKQLSALLMSVVLASSTVMAPLVMADTTNGSIEEQADITNWVANTPQQISNNMAMQHINKNDLNGTKYIVQWGDTLSGISAATGISVAKLAYDNHIQDINLIYAGQTLILNRNGNVPANYHVVGDPNQVVISKTTINNGPKNVKFAVSPKVTVNNDNSVNTTTNNESSDAQSGASDSNFDEGNHDTNATSGSTKCHRQSSSSSKTPQDAEALADKLSDAASDNDDDLNFSKYDNDDADDLKTVDLDDDAVAINKAVANGKFKKAERLIKQHLDDDQKDVVVDYKDGEVTIYTKKDSEKSSSDHDDSSSQGQDNDNQPVDAQDDSDEDDD